MHSQGEAALQSLLQRTDRRHAPRSLMAQKSGGSGNVAIFVALVLGFGIGFAVVQYGGSTGVVDGSGVSNPMTAHHEGKAVSGEHHDEKGKWLDERADHHVIPATPAPTPVHAGQAQVVRRFGGGAVQQPAAQMSAGAGGGSSPAPGKVHVIVTSNGNRYMNWQTRLVYRSFTDVMRNEPDGPLQRFTRVLHRCSDDELKDEVPTFRVDSSRPDCDVWCDYPVADRAPALKMWAKSDDALHCEFVLVAETDYIFMRQLAPVTLTPGQAMSFSFGYIIPTYPTITHIMNRLYKGFGGTGDKDLKRIPGTGNAPVLIHREDFLRVADHWITIVDRIEADPEAVEKLGWVREMYAYSIAAAEVGVHHDTRLPPESVLMVQPPADEGLGKACICHYTWGTILTDGVPGAEGVREVWRWDKREFLDGQFGPTAYKFRAIPPMPAWHNRMHTQDKQPFTEGRWTLLNQMISRINEIIAALNTENNGYPKGVYSDEQMKKMAEPSKKAWDARRAKEMEEARKRNAENKLGL